MTDCIPDRKDRRQERGRAASESGGGMKVEVKESYELESAYYALEACWWLWSSMRPPGNHVSVA